MPKFHFTFAQNHVNNDGLPMKDRWVTVFDADYNSAREKFIKEFSSVHMPRPERWAFQYTEKAFKKEFFPKGEYLVIL
jgi:hypothetical protein